MKEINSVVLGSIGKTYPGLSGKTKSDFGSGSKYIPYLNIFKGGKIDATFWDYVRIGKNEKQYKIKYGDLFFTTSSETIEEVGMTSVLLDHLNEDAYLNSFCFGFRLNNFDTLDPEFARFLFRSTEIRKRISNFGQGSTRYNLPKTEMLRKLILNLPPIPIQQKIAKILSTIDGQIEKTEAIIAKYQAVKQGMLQDLFTRGIDISTGKLRPRYEDAPEQYKESTLGMIPREWEIFDLATVSKLITDGSHFSPIPVENGELIGNVKDMKDWGLDFDGMTRISKKEYDLLARQNCSPEFDDVLLSKDGTIGKVWVYKYKRKIVLLSSIAIIKPNEKIIADFLGELLRSFYFDKHLYMFQSGSALKRLVLGDIKKMTFPIPNSINEQKIIAKRLDSVEQNIRGYKMELNKLKQLKQGLMSDLLSGKVEVTA